MAGDEWNRWGSGENRPVCNGGADKTGGFRADDACRCGDHHFERAPCRWIGFLMDGRGSSIKQNILKPKNVCFRRFFDDFSRGERFGGNKRLEGLALGSGARSYERGRCGG